jgi:hypothetical protein
MDKQRSVAYNTTTGGPAPRDSNSRTRNQPGINQVLLT